MKKAYSLILLLSIAATPVLTGQVTGKPVSSIPGIDLVSSAQIGDHLVFGGDMGFLIRLDDEGTISLLEKTNAEDSLSMYSMIEHIDAHGMAVGTGGSVFKYGIDTWDRVDFGYSSTLRSVFVIDEERAVITATNGMFYLSEDGGASWAEKRLPCLT